MAAQLLQMGNGIVDTLVAGRLGQTELAAGGIGAAMVFATLLVCIGLMAGLSPTVARRLGSGGVDDIGHVFRQGMWLGALLGVVAVVALIGLSTRLQDFGFDPVLVPALDGYLSIAALALLPGALLCAPRNLFEAVGQTGNVLWVQALGLIVNTLGSIGLGFGVAGLPRLGLVGIAWSTTIVSLVVCVALFALLCRPRLVRFRLFDGPWRPDVKVLAALLSLSVPIACALSFEAGLFLATSVQMGMLGALEAAAHQIAVGITAAFYMLPLGLSLAITARLAVADGRGHEASIRLRALTGLATAVVISVAGVALLLLLRPWLPALYTDDPAVRRLATDLLLIAALFQCADALQVSLLGALRGLHDTRVPMALNAIAYWAVGFPVGYGLAHQAGLGAPGLWFGLVAGLGTAALLLGLRLAWMLRRIATSPRPRASALSSPS